MGDLLLRRNRMLLAGSTRSLRRRSILHRRLLLRRLLLLSLRAAAAGFDDALQFVRIERRVMSRDPVFVGNIVGFRAFGQPLRVRGKLDEGRIALLHPVFGGTERVAMRQKLEKIGRAPKEQAGKKMHNHREP